MKKILFFVMACFIWVEAQTYDIYDLNGRKYGSFQGKMNELSLSRIVRNVNGSVLIYRNVKEKNRLVNLSSSIYEEIDLNRENLDNEIWIEVEKNKNVKLCLDNKVLAWETSLNSKIFNDSCLILQTPELIGVEVVDVYLPRNKTSKKINLAVGMKYLKLDNEQVMLGYGLKENGSEDPQRKVSVNATYLVDKYPVTNCEITQLLWDSIPMNVSFKNLTRKDISETWASRKKMSLRNGFCATQDSAANTIFLLQAMKYANARSMREGLIPYYEFASTNMHDERILSKGRYIVSNFDFTLKDHEYIQVSVNKKSNGYRLPYYDEWMAFARGGDCKSEAPWGDSSATVKNALQYAWFGSTEDYYASKPVGTLIPNGYGLYDIFGLVWEHVLLQPENTFKLLQGHPACLKGGGYRVVLNHEIGRVESDAYWKWLNYGYSKPNLGGVTAGFRLVRKLK